MDDQRFSARSAPRAVQTAANDQDSEEDSDNTQHVHAAALPRSKSQRTNRSSYDTNEPIPRTQRRQSTVKRSQSSASRATRASMAPSTASRKSRVPESWWSAAPPGTEKRNGPKHFQVDKTGWMPHSWWEKPTERAVSFPGHNSIYSHHYDDDSDEVDDSDSDGPAPSRTYSTAGTLQRKKSLLPESYWSDKPKPRQSIQRSASRRSRVVYADQGDEDSSDQEGQKVARPKSRASKAPSRAASQRSRLSKPRPSGEATPQRSKSVRSTRASLIDGDRQPSRAPSRAASKLTRNSSRRTTQSTKSRAEVVDEPYTDDDPKHADVATAGVPSRAASRRSRRSEVPTMGEPSTATGFSSRNTSASRLAHQTDVEDDEDDEAGSYYKQSRKSLMRGEDTYVGA